MGRSLANIKDSLLEGVEFELSGDFLNGQQVIRKRQRVQE
jgi:hypothetical protein